MALMAKVAGGRGQIVFEPAGLHQLGFSAATG